MAAFRIGLFFGVCVIVRSVIAVLAWWLGQLANKNFLRAMGCVFLIPMFGFFIRHASYDTSQVGAFGGNVWWNKMRLVHALMYRTFGILAIAGFPQAYVILVIDVVLGTIATTNHYIAQ